jgi:hypothetical protein
VSSIFELDQSGWEQRLADARLEPIAEEGGPGAFEGMLSGTGKGIMRGGARVGQFLGYAAAAPLALYERATDQEGRFTDPYFRGLDETANNAVDFWTPDARTTGIVGRVLGGLGEIALPLAAGGGNPALLIGSQQVGITADLTREGVDPTTAVGVGAVQGAATALGFKIPVLGKNTAQRVFTSAVGNAGLNMATTFAQQKILEGAGYNALAEQYDPLDVEGRTIDLLVGAAFGFLPQGPRAMPRSDRNAVLAAANARHFQVDTAPGRPLDTAASVAHQRAMETAIEQLLRDEPVAVAPEVVNGNFEARPQRDEKETMEALREVLGDIPEPRAPEPFHPVPAGDAAIRNPIDFDATPEVKLAQLKNLTEQNVPVVQKLVEDLNAKLAGTVSKLNVKEDAKILEKASRPSILAKKPWHGVEHIRDSLRFKTVIDRIDQLPGIVDVLKEHGVGVVKVDTAKLLEPGPWGWRIVALDLQLPNGQLVEHYMPIKELEYEADRAKSIALYQAAWEAAAARTGLDDSAALASLKSFSASAESLISTVSSISAPVSGTSVRQTPSTRTAASSGDRTTTVSGDSRNRATSAMSSSEGILPEGGFESPVISAVKELLIQQDIQIPTGAVNEDGTMVVRSAREVMAEAEAGVAKAQQDAQGIEAAVSCFLTRGFDDAA